MTNGVAKTTLRIGVGYWPKEIFTYLTYGADIVKFGGTTSVFLEQLDRPPMGSGRYPEPRGWRTGYFSRIQYVNDESNTFACFDPEKMIKYLNTNSSCYSLMTYTHETVKGIVKFGGPGGTPSGCPRIPPHPTRNKKGLRKLKL
ncbi:hypothetical protein CCACVL1_15999 [Corchorus capsularis]|uniref:Neprosin PEP catalytic domain-containing protein n=1 Tax=Corchorus capsularis TaxID=210143 RepID=A0A1R3I026_COCAP|nr:hypothetical protein CCACVL1_15999 [Corchorus capsularis]